MLDYHGLPPQPTRVRYGVLAFLCTLALLLYVDRVCIGQAAMSISAELHLSKPQMSLIFNAFTLAYCLFEVPTGRWGDRYGSRGVITRIAIWWSIFTALTGAVFGFYSLVAVRFLFGAGEAGAYPNAARVVTRWFPPRDRGLARGSITFVSMVGGTVGPVAASYLILHLGWRWMFAIFGSVGVLWAGAFYAWFRDDPAEHPGTNAAERELILAGVARLPEVHEPIPWRSVLGSANTWLLGAIMGVNSVLFYMLFLWFPTYMKEARGQGEIASGWLTGFVMSGGAAGCIAGGLLADQVLRRARRREWGQRLCGAGALFLAAASMTGARFIPSPAGVTFCNAAAMFFVQVSIPTWWASVAQISGRHGAAMWGLMNSMGALGAVGATYLVGYFVDHAERVRLPAAVAWQGVFDGVTLSLAVGAVCWLAVKPTWSIVGPAAPSL